MSFDVIRNPEVFTDRINSIVLHDSSNWQFYSAADGCQAGNIDVQDYRNFFPYVTHTEILKQNPLGVIPYDIALTPYDEDLNWIDNRYSPNFRGEYNYNCDAGSSWTEDFPSPSGVMLSWAQDWFNNQYGVYKSTGAATIYDRREVSGELWVRNPTRDSVAQGDTALAGIVDNYGWHETLSSTSFDQGVVDVRVFNDILHMRTGDLAIFERIRMDSDGNIFSLVDESAIVEYSGCFAEPYFKNDGVYFTAFSASNLNLFNYDNRLHLLASIETTSATSEALSWDDSRNTWVVARTVSSGEIENVEFRNCGEIYESEIKTITDVGTSLRIIDFDYRLTNAYYILENQDDAVVSLHMNQLVENIEEGQSTDLCSVPQYTYEAAISQAIDSRIAGLEATALTQDIFSSIDDTGDGAYVRQASCWASDLDLTCIAVWNSGIYGVGGNQGGPTVISPLHGIVAHHFTTSHTIGNTVRWVTMDDEVVERTIVSYERVGTTDVGVVRFSSTLPDTITPAKILPANYADYITETTGLPLLVLDQEQHANISDSGIAVYWVQSPTDPTRLDFYEIADVGDSGSPVFMIIDNELVLLWTFNSSSGVTNGDELSNQITGVNSSMANLGGDYTVTEVELTEISQISADSDIITNTRIFHTFNLAYHNTDRGYDPSRDIHGALEGVRDACIRQNSFNILTSPLSSDIIGGEAPFVREVSNGVVDSSVELQYLITCGMNAVSSDDIYLLYHAVPLKTLQDNDYHYSCGNDTLRYYDSIHLGNKGLEYQKPVLGYHSSFRTQVFEPDAETRFRYPHNAERMPLSASTLSCGAIPGSCPRNSDTIKHVSNQYGMTNRNHLFSWLSGSDCDFEWVDRFLVTGNEAVSATNFTDEASQMYLEPGDEYAYVRRGQTLNNEYIASLSSTLVFQIDAINDMVALDSSGNGFDSPIVT